MAVKQYTVSGSTLSSSSTSVVNATGDTLDDGGHSSSIRSATYKSTSDIKSNHKEYFDTIKRNHGLYQRSDIDIFNKRYRLGLFNPYGAIGMTREFLFFTKPDLNIYQRNDSTGALLTSNGSYVLQSPMDEIPYWTDLASKYDNVIKSLQMSYAQKVDGNTNPFNHMLANMCISNLNVPGLDAETVDTPTNMHGVNYQYRGTSEASNDGFDFDLEFKDNRYLQVYQFFKAYEEYETLKHKGIIGPWKGYTMDKVLHDQFAIYKFLVAEDMETIVYYCKFYGVFPKSLPRDVFSSSTFDGGLQYSISFKCAFFDDMDPMILNDFNALSNSYFNSLKYRVDVYNETLDRMDNRPTQAAYIIAESSSYAPGGKVYKLKWKGSDKY